MAGVDGSNLLSAVRPEHVTVTVASRRWDIDLRTAYEWVGAIAADFDDLTGVLPGSLPDDQVGDMWRLSMTLDDIDDRWRYAARVAVGRGAGRDWWWAVNLCRKAVTAWPYINGKLLLSNVDSRRLLFPDYLDAVYMLLYSGMDEEGRTKLDFELNVPPRGVHVTSATRRQFEAFAAD